MIVNKWIKSSDGLPKKNGRYLCVTKSFNGLRHYEVYGFSKNLYKTSWIDFGDKKGVPGFYGNDGEYGFFVVDCVEAWMPIPKYKGE